VDVRAFLRDLPLFRSASGATFDRVVESAQHKKLARGERILSEGEASEHLFVLVDGVVGVFYSGPAGEGVLVKIFGAPAAFGEMEILTGLRRLEYVESFEAVELLTIDKEPLLALWNEHAPSTRAMLDDLAKRLCVTAYHERMLAFFDVETRLAALLLSFLDAYAQPTDDGRVRIRFPLPHDMLARCLGVTTRSIDRAMKKWSDEGLVDRRKGFLVVSSRTALEERAPEDRLALFNQLA
jgi:CRP/FNR family transcriptional regulator, putaive post-exponential-phase nitrogen-starvation regulator